MTNPSNLDLKVGNVTFQLYNGKSFLGTTILPVRRILYLSSRMDNSLILAHCIDRISILLLDTKNMRRSDTCRVTTTLEHWPLLQVMLRDLMRISPSQDVRLCHLLFLSPLRVLTTDHGISIPRLRIVNGSSDCVSLTQAFMAIHLNTTLKGLTSKLLNYANLTVLPTTGVTNSVVSRRFWSIVDRYSS